VTSHEGFRCSDELSATLAMLGKRSVVARVAIVVGLAAAGHDVTPLLWDVDLSGVDDPALRAAAARLFNQRSTGVQQTFNVLPGAAPATTAGAAWGAGEEY
jgi:hypothetical protein